jgi:hypothetical protein
MKIDDAVKKIVDDMKPISIGQRTALENTLQRKRNTAKDIERGLAKLAAEKQKSPISLGKATNIEPTFTGSTASQGMIQIPTHILVAMVRSVGGSVTLDQHDLIRGTQEELEFIMFADPEKVTLRIKEADDAGDPGDRGGYHGFSGVH